MRLWLACSLVGLLACSGVDDPDDHRDPIAPAPDAGIESTPDAPVAEPDTAMPPLPTGSGRAGAPCRTGADCRGGVCLGAPGQREEDNPRFAGGYCTTLGCLPDTQRGCGADEICVDMGGLGTACVEMCSKAEGQTCERSDHVCVGLGAWGGCFSREVVECDVARRTGCAEGEHCIAIGFDDQTIGRCETLCDIFDENSCGSSHTCAYIRKYNVAICGSPGTSKPEESCSCDKCCVAGYGCTPDDDGVGRHCKKLCVVETGEGCARGERCEPLDIDGSRHSEVGGCIAPGSAGT
jgi:hypothetical protein